MIFLILHPPRSLSFTDSPGEAGVSFCPVIKHRRGAVAAGDGARRSLGWSRATTKDVEEEMREEAVEGSLKVADLSPCLHIIRPLPSSAAQEMFEFTPGVCETLYHRSKLSWNRFTFY